MHMLETVSALTIMELAIGVRDNKLHGCTRIHKATAVITAKKEKNQTALGMYCKGSGSSLTVRLEKSPSVIF